MANPVIDKHTDKPAPDINLEEQRERNRALIKLLNEWAADESGYEESHKQQIEEVVKELSQ
ncbi:MAG: hypothetical protein AB1489_17550 [Acidobacteriota bacterium]